MSDRGTQRRCRCLQATHWRPVQFEDLVEELPALLERFAKGDANPLAEGVVDLVDDHLAAH